MKKMNKPEVEAVRFRGGIDVIATSGTPLIYEGTAQDVSNNWMYYSLYTNGREANQCYSSSNYSTNSYYELQFVQEGEDNIFNGIASIGTDALNGNYYYAWYDNGKWWTAPEKYPNAIEYDRS